jgi:transcriptional regulator with XRE-family HTH domain
MAKNRTAIEEGAMAKALLLARCWSQEDLAEKAGLKIVTVRQVLSGRYPFWPARSAINVALGREIFTNPGWTRQLPAFDRMLRSGDVVTKGFAPMLIATPEDERALLDGLWDVVDRHIKRNYVPRAKATTAKKGTKTRD